jgi:simple sugar transport system permease protein
MRKVLKNEGVQAFLASVICILLGLLIGYIVLLFINPAGASNAILDVLKNFMKTSNPQRQARLLGATLVRTAPLLMCSLSVLFAYKVGLFNIGAAGQYVAGAGACLYCALALRLPWFVCLIAAMLAGALLGAISGTLKAYRNVNEVISCIMLNWISLYLVNTLLAPVKNPTGKDTYTIASQNPGGILPSMGLNELFNQKNVTIAIPIAVVVCVCIWVLLNKTKLGLELRATGLHKNAAKYCGMAERRNIILTLVISGALAGLGGALLYLTDYEQWQCTTSSVPSMGFNGIAATFLGGLNPIGTIFSSYFIQHITSGGAYVDKTMYSSQISDLISAIIIYLCGFVLFIKYAINAGIARHEDKEKKRETAGGKGGGN